MSEDHAAASDSPEDVVHADDAAGERAESNNQAEAENGKLFSPSFIGLLGVVFLGATNDNIFRWLVIGIGKDFVTPENIRHVLMIGSVAFVLPYMLLAAPAGYLADRFSKSKVIVCFKAAEIVIMSLGVIGMLVGQTEGGTDIALLLMFSVVFLMGAQSALFGPSRYGAIPEIVSASRISAANGAIGLVSVIATVVGMAIGNLLSDDVTGKFGEARAWPAAATVIGVATLGWFCSLMIRRLRPASPDRKFPINPVSIARQTWRDLVTLASNRAILRVALGVTFFWALGALAQLNIDQYAFEGGATLQSHVIYLLVSLVGGVGLGCVLAGVWSGGRVELGLLPLGSFGIMVSSLLLFTVQGVLIDPDGQQTSSYALACLFLFTLGASAGLFSVPLEAFLQHRSPPERLGSILAASNFITFSCMLAIFLLFTVLRRPTHEGDFVNVDLPKINASQQQDIDSATQSFTSQWKDWTPPAEKISSLKSAPPEYPDLSKAVDAFDEKNVRRVALANLMWVDLQQRKEREAPISYDYYKEQFPDDLGIVYNVFNQYSGLPLFSSAQIFLLLSVLTVPVFGYIIFLLPHSVMRFVVWLLTHTFYRLRVEGLENLPKRGGALLIANHVSWLDGILLMLISSRPVRMIVFAGNFKNRFLNWAARKHGTIMLSPSPKAIARGLKEARQGLIDGEIIAIFPEGGITRVGHLQGFKPGMTKILKGTSVPVIPIYLDELWGSIFSFERGRFFWKWPKRIPYPITIHIGPAIENPLDVHQARQAVAELGAKAVEQRTEESMVPIRKFIRACKQRKFGSKVADSSGEDMSGGNLLIRSLILRRLLRRHVLADDEQYVGVLLPPAGGAIVTNAALALDRRVAVNLNYTVSADVMNYCIEKAGIKHVLTSRKVIDMLNIKIDAELVYLEDFKEKVTTGDKVSAALATFATPAFMLERSLGLQHCKADDLLTIIFTSGSTGTPKGVMLTHGNVGSNVDAINQVVHLTKDDVIIGILPLFHSFGYTVTMWSVLTLDIKGAYHYSPLTPRPIGRLCKRNNGTILLATPTFLRSYLKRCSPEDFASLNVVVAGAEKLPKDLIEGFEEKFGVRPVEGFGATELSPLVSVNIPPSRSVNNFQKDLKEGSVGRAIPGVTAKVVHLETGEELSAGEEGMLMIKGPNVMQGYLDLPDKTAEVIQDGWYVTGDVAMIDEDGFITITGRQSRFSKIGGEMVPHVKIEDQLADVIGGDREEGLKAVITAVPDAKKGERLVVIHTSLEKSPDELVDGLRAAGLPNLFIPSTDCFLEVEELPVLGTGKLDLKGIRKLAEERMSAGKEA